MTADKPHEAYVLCVFILVVEILGSFTTNTQQRTETKLKVEQGYVGFHKDRCTEHSIQN